MKKEKILAGILCGVVSLSCTFPQIANAEEDAGNFASSTIATSGSSEASSSASSAASEASTIESSDNAASAVSASDNAGNENDNAGNNASSVQSVTQLSAEIDGKSINVTADPGVLPDGTTLVVTDIADMDGLTDAIVDNTDLTSNEISDVIAYDISIHNSEGEEIEPDASKGKVSVTITDISGAADYNVYHVSDDKKDVETMDASASGSDITYETTHFSYYAFVKISDTYKDSDTTHISYKAAVTLPSYVLGQQYKLTDILTSAGYDYSAYSYVNMPDTYVSGVETCVVKQSVTGVYASDTTAPEEYYYCGAIADSYIQINTVNTCPITLGLYDSSKSNSTVHDVTLYISIADDGTHDFTIGDGVYADYDAESGTMTISGSGIITVADPFAGIDVKSLIIGEGITNTGIGICKNQLSLTSVTLPSTCASVDSYAFSGCCALSSITIPDGVTSIGSNAFYNDYALSSMSLPDGITDIGEYAYYNCTSMAMSSLPSSLKTVGTYAFFSCTQLTAGTLPDSVTTIGSMAFRGCSGVTFSTLPSSLTSAGTYAFYGCTGVTFSTIPAGLTAISQGLFCNCSGVTFSTIPDTVTSIASYAFKGCSKITISTIPSGITQIQVNTFYGCSGITHFTIPSDVTTIAKNAFTSCTGIAKITIGSRVTSIDSTAFTSDKFDQIVLDNVTLSSAYTLPATYYHADASEITALAAGTKYSETLYITQPSTTTYTVIYYDSTGSTKLYTETVSSGSDASYTHTTDGEPDTWVTTAGGTTLATLTGITTDMTVYAAAVICPTVTMSIPTTIALTYDSSTDKLSGTADVVLSGTKGTGYISSSPLGSWTVTTDTAITLTNQDNYTTTINVTSGTADKDKVTGTVRQTTIPYTFASDGSHIHPGDYTGSITFTLAK